MLDCNGPDEASCLKQESSARNKFILDATAGFREIWFNKKHPNTVYLDQKAECEPTEIGDFRNLNQFSDESFRLIIFDPPHIVQKSCYNGAALIRKYGVLEAETWQSDFKKAFSEFYRVLKPYGILLFKWTNLQVSSPEVLKLTDWHPLLYQVTSKKAQKISHKNTTRNLRVMWFCFMKIPEEGKPC